MARAARAAISRKSAKGLSLTWAPNQIGTSHAFPSLGTFHKLLPGAGLRYKHLTKVRSNRAPVSRSRILEMFRRAIPRGLGWSSAHPPPSVYKRWFIVSKYWSFRQGEQRDDDHEYKDGDRNHPRQHPCLARCGRPREAPIGRPQCP